MKPMRMTEVVVAFVAAMALPGAAALAGPAPASAPAVSDELAKAPVARAAAKPPEDWAHLLDELAPAISVCLEDGVPSAQRVLKAWPMNRGKVGVRLVDAEGETYDCIAERSTVDSVRKVEEGAPELPGAGRPVLWRAGDPSSLPPVPRCGRLERVLDAQSRLVGWLQYDGC
jgi:hypothetical protein